MGYAMRCDAMLNVLSTEMYMNIHMYKMAEDDVAEVLVLLTATFLDRFVGKNIDFGCIQLQLIVLTYNNS